MKAALIFPESLDVNSSVHGLREVLSELGMECEIGCVSSPEETEAVLGQSRPDIVLVATGDPGTESQPRHLPALSEIAYIADYSSGRVALFGEIAETSPELFLSETNAVVITGNVAFVSARLAALPAWDPDSLRCLEGLVFKENGRLVRV